MTGIPAIDAFIGVLGALATAFSMFWGGRKLMAESRALKSPPPTPYEALAARVTHLEDADASKGREIARLRGEVRSLRGWLGNEVRFIIEWIDRGAPPPPPEREVQRLKELIQKMSTELD